MVAADIFGYVMWNLDDTGIGQKGDAALDAVDVVCPMLYPSGYQFGIPLYKNTKIRCRIPMKSCTCP